LAGCLERLHLLATAALGELKCKLKMLTRGVELADAEQNIRQLGMSLRTPGLIRCRTALRDSISAVPTRPNKYSRNCLFCTLRSGFRSKGPLEPPESHHCRRWKHAAADSPSG
jgi:hypothetical protein